MIEIEETIDKLTEQRSAGFLYTDGEFEPLPIGLTHTEYMGSTRALDRFILDGGIRLASGGWSDDLNLELNYVPTIAQRKWLMDYLKDNPEIGFLYFGSHFAGWGKVANDPGSEKKVVGKIVRFFSSGSKFMKEDDDWDLSDVEVGGGSTLERIDKVLDEFVRSSTILSGSVYIESAVMRNEKEFSVRISAAPHISIESLVAMMGRALMKSDLIIENWMYDDIEPFDYNALIIYISPEESAWD